MPETEGHQVRVLVVSPDPECCNRVRECLSEASDCRYDLEWASSYEIGLRDALANAHDVAIVDDRLDERNGLELVAEAVAQGCRTPLILLTGQNECDVDRAAMSAGAVDYLSRGLLDRQSLERSVQYALQRRRAEDAVLRVRARELEIGARIQRALLLSDPPPNLQGVSIGAISRASQQIGGDFWEFLIYSPTCFDVLVGDVMGKGVPAALLAAATKAHFQDCARRLALALDEYNRLPEPEEIVAAAHYAMTGELAALDSFVTLCCGRFDLRARRFTFVDAGHMRTVHHRSADGVTSLLQGENLPLGVSDNEIYAQKSVTFGVDDVFVFYSDGVTGSRDAECDLYGTERLLQVVKDSRTEQAEVIAGRVCDAAMAFAGSAGLSDDLTCLVVCIDRADVQTPLDRAAMEVHSTPEEIAGMRHLVEWFSSERASPPLSPHERSSLVLAVSEAASNILDHAYWGSRDKRLQVAVEAYEGEVHVVLSDWGRPFDPRAVAQPMFDGSRDGGFGVYIITQAVDDYRYYRDDLGRNCLRLVRRSRGRVVGEPPADKSPDA